MLLEKVIVTHLLKKLLAFCKTRRFIIGFYKSPPTTSPYSEVDLISSHPDDQFLQDDIPFYA